MDIAVQRRNGWIWSGRLRLYVFEDLFLGDVFEPIFVTSDDRVAFSVNFAWNVVLTIFVVADPAVDLRQLVAPGWPEGRAPVPPLSASRAGAEESCAGRASRARSGLAPRCRGSRGWERLRELRI